MFVKLKHEVLIVTPTDNRYVLVKAENGIKIVKDFIIKNFDYDVFDYSFNANKGVRKVKVKFYLGLIKDLPKDMSPTQPNRKSSIGITNSEALKIDLDHGCFKEATHMQLFIQSENFPLAVWVLQQDLYVPKGSYIGITYGNLDNGKVEVIYHELNEDDEQ